MTAVQKSPLAHTLTQWQELRLTGENKMAPQSLHVRIRHLDGDLDLEAPVTAVTLNVHLRGILALRTKILRP